VRDHMSQILRRLKRTFDYGIHRAFQRAGGGRRLSAPSWWYIFWPMLELARESLLDITQAEPYAPIYLRLSIYAPRLSMAGTFYSARRVF